MLAKVDTIDFAIQVNGKLRGTVSAPVDSQQKKIQPLAEKTIEKWLTNKQIAKIIFVPAKLINFVVKD